MRGAWHPKRWAVGDQSNSPTSGSSAFRHLSEDLSSCLFLCSSCQRAIYVLQDKKGHGQRRATRRQPDRLLTQLFQLTDVSIVPINTPNASPSKDPIPAERTVRTAQLFIKSS